MLKHLKLLVFKWQFIVIAVFLKFINIYFILLNCEFLCALIKY